MGRFKRGLELEDCERQDLEQAIDSWASVIMGIKLFLVIAFMSIGFTVLKVFL